MFFITATVLLIFIVIPVGSPALSAGDPHMDANSECSSCHRDLPGNPQSLTAPVTELCIPCHRKTIRKSSHLVDIFPKAVRVPRDLPLSGGRITCVTCHSMHAVTSNYSLRRSSTGLDFCTACHGLRPGKDAHMRFLASAHAGSRYLKAKQSEIIDPLSKDCIGCHDGALGGNVFFQIGGIARGPENHVHPVGVRYDRGMDSGLKPLTRINGKIRFFGGKIGCCTCHNLYSDIPKRLVMKNERSRLCLSCHLK